jgi:hypothetical protein
VIKVLSPVEWQELSEVAHLVCFDELRPKSLDRIDFALVVVEENVPLAYTTVKELDSESAYMQFGGAFPSAKGTAKSLSSYLEMVSFLKSKYKRISTIIQNTNTPMMKFAMKADFLVIGVRIRDAEVYLEHFLECKEATCGN